MTYDVRSFGQALAAERLAAGYTQSELAARAGITAFEVSRIERGDLRADAGLRERLLSALSSPPPAKPPRLRLVKDDDHGTGQ